MKELVKLQNVSYEIENNIIFKEINSVVKQGEIIGIIGKNGAGKSTLLQLIKGMIVPTNGHLVWNEIVEIAYVEQEEEAFAHNEVTALEVGFLSKWKVPNIAYSELSGGEKLKMRLAKGFAIGAPILLLDEPTNHLDEQSTELLIEQIKGYSGTVIIVSHDRHFLDAVTTKIWSFESSKLIEYIGNYTSYMRFREQKRLSQQREYEKQQKNIERIEEQMDMLNSWSHKAHAQSTIKGGRMIGAKEYYRVKAKKMDIQVKSKRKRLEKELERKKIERVEEDYKVRFSIQANEKVGKRFLQLKNVTKAFGDRRLFANVHFTIQHGEKIALVGPNGCGKTTLLKIIMGQERAAGEVWLSPSANIGYLTQEVFDLPLEKTPEQLFYRETFEERGKVQNLLKHLGFTVSQWIEPIRNMSMGERVKCKLMVYILEEKDVLILDEPTNHLDLPSREQLEETLADYNGTLLVVSHDRYFLEKITNDKLIFSNGMIQKQLQNVSQKRDDLAELLLKLETERQEVLGKLSFLTSKNKDYAELDEKFKVLTKQINELKRKF